jgi:response regulator RpfG family c-di-GMP phosphodiesterase
MVQISSCGFLPLLIWTSYFRLGHFDEAVEEVRNCSGTQFDPLVAEAFLDLIDQGVISE